MQKRILNQIINIDKVAYKEVNFKSKLLEWSQKNRVRLEFKQVEQTKDENSSPVFVYQVSSSDTAFAICVRNVTRYGFEVRLRYEGRLHKPNHTENLAYLAVSEGCGSITILGF